MLEAVSIKMSELDELNKLFTSKNVDDVIKFYDHFDNAEQLIEWMKSRPSAPMKIYEVEGDKDIVIVIPTANHNGEYARNCADEIFKGQQIVFVDSNGPFFNYARSCNFGLKYALKYNPKWIILSNDDVIKVDQFSKLKDALSSIDPESTDIVYITPSNYHSISKWVVKANILLKLIMLILDKNYYDYIRILRKFSIKYDMVREFRLRRGRKLLYKTFYKFLYLGDFVIFSNKFISSKEKVFDETYINNCEDVALSLSISSNDNTKIKFVDFILDDKVGGTLGQDKSREFRGIISLCYIQDELLAHINHLEHFK